MIRMCKSQTSKIITEIFCLVLLSVTLIAAHFYIDPHNRGFFCNDQTIMYPYVESETISTSKLIITGSVFFLLVIIGEILNRKSRRSSVQLLNFKLPNWIILIYHKAGCYLIGGVTTVLIGEVIKLSVGRLRPHFFDVCAPNINCNLTSNHNRYFRPGEFYCTSNFTGDILKEARLSFPSTHASFITYFGVYFICYLQLRIPKNLKILNYTIQFIVVGIIFFISMTRISDYWHHWSDVTVGIFIGLGNALITVFFVADFFQRPGFEINEAPTEIDIHVASA